MYLVYKTDEPYAFKKLPSKKSYQIHRRNGWSLVSCSDFGEKMHMLRDRLGITQEEMAKLISKKCSPTVSLNPKQYYRWEQGKSLKRVLDGDLLMAISDAFQVPLDYLAGINNATPEIWKGDSIFSDPPKRIGSPPVEIAQNLRIYHVETFYQGTNLRHSVLADSPTSASHHVMQKTPGAVVKKVELAEKDPATKL